MDDKSQFAYIISVLISTPDVEWDVEVGRGGEKWLWYGKWSGGPMTILSQHRVEKMTEEELASLAIELTFGVG